LKMEPTYLLQDCAIFRIRSMCIRDVKEVSDNTRESVYE
jgi:hypothetical protein